MTQRTDEPDPAREDANALSRRRFLKGAGEVAAGGVIASGLIGATARTAAGSASAAEVETLAGEVDIELTINGAKQTLKVEPRTTLLSALRNHCSPTLTGTKLVCDRGNCGACTVIVDGSPRYACLQLAVDLRGKEIRTIEGLATGDELTPLQDEFCKQDALMCGFCTPGFLMSITAALEKKPNCSLEEVKQSCAGNVCRCGTYPHIFTAALAAGKRMGGR
ncbi:MAG: 2Fe-2S iron-sulfur cluster-binding protein [Planctomycetota bacterium]|nr:2Fe-2S iron-sulfur cluster-binding protein [Planctomycetota bacterium]